VKLVYELHLKWGTLLPNLGTLTLWVQELFAMNATYGQRPIDGRTDGRTDESDAYCPFCGEGITLSSWGRWIWD